MLLLQQMQAVLRNCEWDDFEARYGHHRVRCVYRRAASESVFTPWVVIAPSIILQRLGVNGLGLYALRGFRRDDYIGKYDGTDEGHFETREEAHSSPRARQLLRRGHDKLLTVRANGPGVILLDGETGGPPFLQFCNDPRGTALTPNTEMTPYGYLRVTHSRVPAFRFDRTLEENSASELRWDYGDSYWAFHDQLGRNSQNAIECD